MSTVDLAKVYPDPLGGDYTSAMDVHMRRGKFGDDLGKSLAALAAAGSDLAGYAGRRELADPYWRGLVAQVRDARVKAVAACDGLLEALGEGPS